MPEHALPRHEDLVRFGRETLGPVVNHYLARLHVHLRHCWGPDTRILFCLRAGLRIRELYGAWLAARGLPEPPNASLLKISRLMAIKAGYARVPQLAMTALGQELPGVSLGQILNGVMRPEIEAGRCPDLADTEPMPLHEFLQTDTPRSRLVRDYLLGQSELYAQYLQTLAGDARRLVLVDSGWRGTSQLLLENAFPQYEWEGVYFGCMGRAEVLGVRPRSMHGMVFDAPAYDPGVPETAFALHRHMIESLLEPGMASVDAVSAADLKPARKRQPLQDDPWDAVYQGALAAVRDGGRMGLLEAERSWDAARQDIARLLGYPTAEEALLAQGKPRSHDLGRPGAVEPLVTPDPLAGQAQAERRIAESLWAQGQIALEYGGAAARRRQQQELERTNPRAAANFFTGHLEAAARPGPDASVAVITRTKNRAVLLERAARSVAAQTWRHYTWVIVNDGGDLDEVMRVVNAAQVLPEKVLVCSNARSVGMEAASNMGIRASDSRYVVIHDDDDSWDPRFLERAVAFLEANARTYHGVVTGSTYVSEAIRGGEVVERGRWPYNDWVACVQLSEMLVGNFFPPIAFVFRRSIWEQLGGFDESLPVLGDWDFNLRFLMAADIGVVREPLAFYHHRDTGEGGGAYANSVVGAADRHAEYNAVVRNRYLRAAAGGNGSPGLHGLLAASYYQQDIRHRLDRIARQPGPEQPHPASNGQAASLALLQERLDRRWVQLVVRDADAAPPRGELSVDDALSLARRRPLPPPPDFDEPRYLELYPDVADAVARGAVPGAFNHYLIFGRKEGRARPATSA